jgi:hypothetical protein
MTSNASIYQGDFVKKNANGKVDVATPGDRLLGVAANTVRAASKSIHIYTDPEIIYRIQQDESGTAIQDPADYGLLADLTTEHSANVTLGLSGMELDANTKGTGRAQLRVEMLNGSVLYKSPDNAVGNNAEILVSIFEHDDKVPIASDSSPGT